MTLPIWVIYERPRDYPIGWVVRCWSAVPGRSEPVPSTEATFVCDLRARLVREVGDEDPLFREVAALLDRFCFQGFKRCEQSVEHCEGTPFEPTVHAPGVA